MRGGLTGRNEQASPAEGSHVALCRRGKDRRRSFGPRDCQVGLGLSKGGEAFGGKRVDGGLVIKADPWGIRPRVARQMSWKEFAKEKGRHRAH